MTTEEQVRRTGLVGRALAGGVAAMIGTTALATTAAGPAAAAPLPLPIRVKFGPQGTVLPDPSWTLDSGQQYGADDHDYGWVHAGTDTPVSLVGNAVPVPSESDVMLDSFIHMQADDFNPAPPMVSAEGAWEAALPPGTYTVSVAVGDKDHVDSDHWVNIEGKAGIVHFVPTSGQYGEITRTVTVNDGRITIDARGGTNTKLISVQIAAVPAGGAWIDTASVTHRATDVFLNSTIQLTASLTVDPSTIAGNVVVETLAGGAVPASVMASGATLTIDPTNAVAARTTNVVSVRDGLQATDGTPFRPFQSVFTTGTLAGSDVGPGGPEVEVTPASVVVDDVIDGGTEPAGTVVVRNVGSTPLTVTSSLTGPGWEQWRIGSAPPTIAPGVAATVPVEFAPTATGPNVGASLRLTTNDPDESVVDVPLRGLGTAGTYGELEPSTQWILDTLGYTINVGDPNPLNAALPGGSGLLGEEVVARAFRAAQAGSPVTVEPVAVFGPEHVDPVMRVGWYLVGQPTPVNPLFSVSEDDAQELLSFPVGATTFSPGTDAFGLAASSPFGANKPVYTQDSLNVWDSDPGSPHNIRAYPLRQGGGVVPNAYLFAVEGFASGDDFQDLVFIARNVQIVSELGEVGVQPAELVMSAAVGASSQAQIVTVSNTGAMPLAVGSITLSGPDASSFLCPACSSTPAPPPITIAPGTSITRSITFSPTTGNPGSRHAVMRVLSDDSDEATVDVGFHGLATTPGGGGGGGTGEPPLHDVVDVLGYTINVGGTQLNLPTTPGLIGDEIDGRLLEPASAGLVTVSAVARYAAASAVSFGWYPAASGTLNTAASIGAAANQTLNPATTPAGPISFSPGGRFGLFINRGGAVAYSEDARNAGSGHRMRVYPLRDRAGVPVANSYLVAIDDDDSNGDYQDLVLRIDNVKVNDFTAPPVPSGLTAAPQPGSIALDWADVAAPDLAGYRVYRDGQLITPSILQGSSHADGGAALGTVHSYGVSSVDIWGNESGPTIVFARRPPAPVAGFVISLPVATTVPATEVFTDASSGEPTAWAWDFQSDGVVDATTPNATFVYSSPGTYAVTLTVSNVTGTDVETKALVVSAGGGGGPGGPIGSGDPGVVCGGAGPWTVGMPSVGPTTFHPVTPGRILDTRDGTGAPAGKLDAGCTLALDVTGLRGIPADGVHAVSLNVTATEAVENGYVTVYPCAAGRPATSSLNTQPGRDIANLVTLPVGADGLVCFYTYRSVHLLADVAGWFGDGGSRMTGLAPARVLDTRDGTGATAAPVAAGGVVSVQVAGWGGVPATGVSAVVLNLTATESTSPGYLSAYPCDQEVYASALNYIAGQTVANHVLVPLDSAGQFCISSYAQSDVIADVLGYYGAPGGLEGSRFTPLTPSRIVDTRSNLPAGASGLDAGNMLPVDALGSGGVPNAGVDAVMFNLTSADAAGPGYLTAFPCGGVTPNASNVNHVASAAASNLVTVPLGTGGQVCIFSYADSDVLVDVAGYFAP